MEYERDIFSLLDGYASIDKFPSVGVRRLCIDSSKIRPGDCFIALPGKINDGRTFITEAINNGAVAILQESLQNYDTVDFIEATLVRIPVVGIKNLSNVLGYIASRFYNYPSSQMHMVGVTGTNGKTSITFFLSKALSILNRTTAMIGTIGIGKHDHLEMNQYTTPDTIMTHQSISKMLDQGIENLVMEVSSHGIQQGRVKGVSFDTLILTNIKDHEHLDFHHTFENYKQVKSSLFESSSSKYRIFNLDDQAGLDLYRKYHSTNNTFGYKVGHPESNEFLSSVIYATDINCSLNGLTFCAHSPWGNAIVRTRITGTYNVYNILAVIAALAVKKIPFDQIVKAISKLTNVPGRMDVFGSESSDKPLVIVDYAHTPDALELVLKQLQLEKKSNIVCVFGCGGDRHIGKREMMGEVASRYCDKIYLTDDNPRSEPSESIIEDIIKGVIHDCELFVETDRLKAISMAIGSSSKDDIILIAGKGHETKQIMKNYEIDMSDIQQVQQQLSCFS